MFKNVDYLRERENMEGNTVVILCVQQSFYPQSITKWTNQVTSAIHVH